MCRTSQAAELQLLQATAVALCDRGVVVVGDHQQSVLTLVEVPSSDQPQVDQWDGRHLVHGNQNVASHFLDGLKKKKDKTKR